MSDSLNLQPDVSLTHFFIYKKDIYPFNMAIFNQFSQYFQKQLNQPTAGIKIIEDTEEDNLNLKKSAITDFVNYCQNHPVEITQDNFITIHKLANKFIVPTLIQATEKFSLDHKQQLIDAYLSSTKDEQDTILNETEEIISNDLPNYLNDERLLKLSLPVIQRILIKYRLSNQGEHPELCEFLFKCLDTYKREGSVLFENLDFGLSNALVIRRLLKQYPDEFDFKFITNGNIKAIYVLEQEHLEIEKNLEIKLNENEAKYKNMIEKAEEIIKKQQEENEKYQNKINEQINLIQKRHQMEIEEIQKKQMKIFDESLNKISLLEMKFDKLYYELNDTAKKVTDLDNQIKNLNKKEEEKILSCPFDSSKDGFPKGILNKIGPKQVTITDGGSENPTHPLENILKNDNSYFSNYFNNSNPSSDKSYILFDFGTNKKVELEHYFLKASDGGDQDRYPRQWFIEGSNDCQNWIQLDEQFRDSSLKGKYLSQLYSLNLTYKIKGPNNNRFRYIRYKQLLSWNDKAPYSIQFSYFELFGNVYDV